MTYTSATASLRLIQRNRFKLWAAAAVAASALIDHNAAYATTATWLGTTDSSWATGTDWSGGTAPGSTASTASTDAANFNNAGNSHTTVTVDSNRNIDQIIFDTSNAAAYTFSGGSLLGTNGGQIVMNSTVVNSQTFQTPLTIEGSKSSFALINNSANASATLNYAGTIQAVSGGTLELGGTDTGQNTISGAIINGTGSNVTNVVENGTGTWTLSGNDTYSGQTFVSSGTLIIPSTFAQSGGRITSDGGTIQISGTVSKVGATVDYGGQLSLNGNGQLSAGSLNVEDNGVTTLDNSVTLLNNRLNGNGLLVWGGTLNYISGTGASSEQLGSLTLAEGASVVQLNPNAGGSTIVTATSINRSGISTATNPTLLLIGKNFGAAPAAGNTNLVVNATGATAPEIGGGGASGTTDVSIENFVVTQDLALSGNAQYGLVTGIGSTNGLRALSSSEYANSISDSLDTSSTLRNINLTANSPVNGLATTINALRLDTGGAVSGFGTLTVNSGAILALPGNSGISVTNLNFGPEEAIFHAIGDLTVNGNITGTGGLTKTGAGVLYLASASALSYTGNTAVNQGTLRFGAANQLSANSPFILDGGTADLNGFSQTLMLKSGQAAGSGSLIINSDSKPTATLTISSGNIAQIVYRGAIGTTGASNISVNVDMGIHALFLTHASTYTGSTTISSGDLLLDFSAPDSPAANILPSTSHVDNGGEFLAFVGSSANTQSLNGMTMEPGPGAIIQLSTDSITYPEFLLPPGQLQENLGTLTHNIGAVADIYPLGNGSGFTTSTANTNGIIGGWAIFNSQDWAVANGSNDISALSSYTADTWSAGANVTVTTNSTQTNVTANT
ncbi:MAG TPA: autotransporter-associated beta strand repeat-containing protein, partial [Tepidisphaeraceae bacterium]